MFILIGVCCAHVFELIFIADAAVSLARFLITRGLSETMIWAERCAFVRAKVLAAVSRSRFVAMWSRFSSNIVLSVVFDSRDKLENKIAERNQT